MSLAMCSRFVCFIRWEPPSSSATATSSSTLIVLWDFQREKTRVVRPPGNSILSHIHIIQGVEGSSPPYLVALGDGVMHVWDVSSHIDYVRTIPVVDKLNLNGSKLRLCGPDLDLSSVQRYPEDEGIVDCCRASEWLTVGVTSSEVLWLKSGTVMCSFDDWYGPQGRKVDAKTNESEKLLCVASNELIVCVATDFGNIYVLDRTEMTHQQTLPLGVLVSSMCLTGKSPLLALEMSDGAVRIVHVFASYFVDYIEESLIGETSSSRITDKSKSNQCLCCLTTPNKCVAVENHDVQACRNTETGKTIAKLRRGSQKWTLVKPMNNSDTRASNKLFLIHNNYIVTCGERGNEVRVFRVDGESMTVRKCKVLELEGLCIDFDVDQQKKNRIVALSASGNIYVFPFFSKSTTAAQVINFEKDLPRHVAAHSGRIAIADEFSIMVLLKHGQGDGERFDKTCLTKIRSLDFNGPYQLVINQGEDEIELE